MTKGTTSKGKRHNKSHIVCRRCNQSSFHIQKHLCAHCGYPNARIRNTTNHRLGSNKARRRKTTGTGRCRYLKTMPRRFKNGFQSGTEAKRMVSVSAK